MEQKKKYTRLDNQKKPVKRIISVNRFQNQATRLERRRVKGA